LKQPRSAILIALLGLGLAAWHAAEATRWSRSDATPPPWDAAVHLGTAQDYRDALAAGRPSGLLATRAYPGHAAYPPAYHLGLVALLSAERPHAEVVVHNLLYFFILCAAAAAIAWTLGGAAASATTLFVAALSPGLIFHFREPFPDLALSAWVAAAYAFALRSGPFRTPGLSLAAGACAALAFASKWTAFVYLAPLAFAGLSRERRKMFALSLLPMLAIVPWYLVNGAQTLPRMLHSASLGAGEGDPGVWTWDGWFYYARFLNLCHPGPLAGLLAVGSLLALARRSSPAPAPAARVLVALWLAVSYGFWSLVSNKDWRYMLPAAVALPALGVTGLPSAGLLLAGGLAVAGAGRTHRPDGRDWRERDVLEALRVQAPEGRDSALCVLANHRQLNPTSWTWLVRHSGPKRLSVGCSEAVVPEWADFVLVKEGEPGVFMSDATLSLIAAIRRGDEAFKRFYRETGRWPLPDGSQAALYALRPDYPRLSRPLRLAETPVRSAKAVGVTLTPQSPGVYLVDIESAVLSKVPAPLRGLRLRLSGARVGEWDGRPRLLGAESVTILRGAARWDELSLALSRRAGVPISFAAAPGGGIAVSARLWRVGASAVLEPSLEGSEGSLTVSRLRLAGLPLPVPRLRLSRSLAAAPPGLPFSVSASRLVVDAEGFHFEETP